MPRDGSNIYHIPPGTAGVPNTTVESAKYNAYIADVEQDLNLPRPIVAGGSGASSADGALDNLSAEKYKMVVANWDTMAWRAGSFYALANAIGVAPGGLNTHAFAGIAYFANATDFVLEATDLFDPANPVTYTRVMAAGVWSAWSRSASSGTSGSQIGEFTFDTAITFPPAAGTIRFNNATQNSTTELFISHLTATGVDVTTTLPFVLRNGYELAVADKTDVTKYKIFTITGSPVLSGGDIRVLATVKTAGADLTAQHVLLNTTPGVITGTAGSQIGDFLFDTAITFPPASGTVRLNNATQNSATEIFISHLSATGVDVTTSLPFALRVGYDIAIADKANIAKYKIFTIAADPVLSGGDIRVLATLKTAGVDLTALRVLLNTTPGSSVRFDIAQTLTDDTLPSTVGQKTQARRNIYAAPFDALAYNGMQLNGSMEVSQEKGAVGTTIANQFVLDGWRIYWTGTMALTGARGAASVPGFINCLTFGVNTAQPAMGAGDAAILYQNVEGYRVARLGWGTVNAQPITIGFWSSHVRAGLYSLVIRNALTNRAYPATYTQAAGNVAQYNVVTIPGDTTGTWAKDNSTGLTILACFASGSTFTAPAANAWQAGNYYAAPGQVNGVATLSDSGNIHGLVVLPGLEAPSAARSPYIMRPYDEELATCRRYYYRRPVDIMGYATVAGIPYGGFLPHPVAMRAAPTMSATGGAQTNCGAMTVDQITAEGGRHFVSNTATGAFYADQVQVTADARI